MKGFFRWFKQNAKMKRWILLILIGVVLCCYGMSTILTSKQMDFVTLAEIIGGFVAGFVCVVIGIVSMQKRTLELLVQDTDTRVKDKNSKVKSLIFNKKIYNQGPKIVAIGGGSGLNSVLKGLKHYTDNITAIVTVSSYGEPVSESRQILDTLPLDDIKDSLIALSANENEMSSLLNHNFKNSKLSSLSFSDVYLLAMKEIYGDFTESIKQTQSILNMTGKVLPVTLEEIKICAELEDGTVVECKDKIPDFVNEKTSKISRMYISPSNCRPAPGVLEAIMEADAIVIGPGSLYTNIIPNLLVKGVSKTIKESKAFKIYVSNLMTEPGQTDNYTLSEHIKAINEHAGKGVIDYCIYDTGEIIPEFIRRYNMEGSELVEQDTSKAKVEGVSLMQRNLSFIDGEFIRHNPDAIGASIIQLICDDLKFKDMQNDAQYVMLNDKLKDIKKNMKVRQKSERAINEANAKKKNSRHQKGNTKQSKFSKKYQERIESIQEAERKLKQKEMRNKNQSKHAVNNDKLQNT